tara:strand:+ start:160 stop:990 length:831 start_codon:yes stop_codon:yes gene_type:complete
MRYGITGSKGFLGSSLYLKLKSSKKANVICDFDPRYTEIPDSLDVIFHLGYSSVQDYHNKYKISLESDFESAKSIATYCQKNFTHLIFISSAAVYTKNLHNNYYAQSKIEIENLLLDFFDSKFYPLTIVRLFNPYGPGQSLNYIIPQIINSLSSKKKLIINEPKSKRDFVFVDDFLELISECPKDEIAPYVFDFGTGTETSIEELVKLISKKINIDYKDFIEFNQSGFTSNIRVDRGQFDIPSRFKFKYSLDDGIQKVIDTYKTYSNISLLNQENL